MRKEIEYDVSKIISNLNDIYNPVTFKNDENKTVEENNNLLFIENYIKPNKVYQQIFYGPPGTGKSYNVAETVREVYPDYGLENGTNIENAVFRTTVYADYSYYDFIGNIMPVTVEDRIDYAFNPGIFTEALKASFLNPEYDIFLIIEEMSRGNIASIFGDVFQLLDRDRDGTSEYLINNSLISKYLAESNICVIDDKIYLPGNLHILGTLNTSDQNVNVIDTAFKRRFGFVYTDILPVRNENNKYLNSFSFELGYQKFEWNKFYMSLNKFITEILDLTEDKQLGQFFIKFDNLRDDEDRFEELNNKLIQYLWDDIQDVSLSEVNLFAPEYKTFRDVYMGFRKKNMIFSTKFLDLYDNFDLEYEYNE